MFSKNRGRREERFLASTERGRAQRCWRARRRRQRYGDGHSPVGAVGGGGGGGAGEGEREEGSWGPSRQPHLHTLFATPVKPRSASTPKRRLYGSRRCIIYRIGQTLQMSPVCQPFPACLGVCPAWKTGRRWRMGVPFSSLIASDIQIQLKINICRHTPFLYPHASKARPKRGRGTRKSSERSHKGIDGNPEDRCVRKCLTQAGSERLPRQPQTYSAASVGQPRGLCRSPATSSGEQTSPSMLWRHCSPIFKGSGELCNKRDRKHLAAP